MGPFDIGKFVEELFQWEPHRVGAFVTGLLLGAAVALFVWKYRRAQVKELDGENSKLKEGANRLWDRNAALQETIEELRKRLTGIEQQVGPDVAVKLEKTLQEIGKQQQEDEEDTDATNGEPSGQGCWIIAPFSAEEPTEYRRVWQFDLANKVISVGWGELGDISSYDEGKLREEIDRTYCDVTAQARGHYFSMLWKFYHGIKVGDTVIARQGTRKIAAVGTVRGKAYYRPNWSPARSSYPDGPQYPNHVDVEWHDSPRDKSFSKAVFGILTVYKVPETRFRYLLDS